MEQTFNRREWLEWLTRVRLLMIALILGVGVVWPQYVPASGISRYFLDHHSVDHHRNPSVNSRATPAVGCVARATPGFLRRGDDHGRCLHDRAARQQFHRLVPAGDYRGEHLVLAPGNVYHLAFLYFLAGADRGTCPRGEAPAHFACPTVD